MNSCAEGRASLGHAGENAASAWLAEHGFTILDRNWRYGKWELDIVCVREGAIHFVEVKTRSGRGYGGAASAISHAQQKRLLLAAQAWLTARESWGRHCQFDIICVSSAGNALTVECYANAFNWDIMGDSGAHRQYW